MLHRGNDAMADLPDWAYPAIAFPIAIVIVGLLVTGLSRSAEEERARLQEQAAPVHAEYGR